MNIAKSGWSLGRKQFPLSPKTLQSYKNNIVSNLEDVEWRELLIRSCWHMKGEQQAVGSLLE